MYGQHVAPQTHNKRTGLSIRDVKRHADARIAAFGVSILVAGLLLLPCAALATEMPETDVAAPITCDEANAEGSLTATTVVDHNYDLELPPAFMLVQEGVRTISWTAPRRIQASCGTPSGSATRGTS